MNKSGDLTTGNNIFWTVNLVIVTFFWGVTFVLVKDAIQSIHPVTFIFLRFFGTTIISLMTLRFFYASSKLSDLLFNKHGWILGFLLFTAFLFQTIGLNYTTPGNAAFITSLYVPFVPLFLLVFYKKEISRLIYLWTALAVIGLALLSLNFNKLSINQGDMLIIITAIAFAFHIIQTSNFSEYIAEGSLVFSQFLSTTIFSFLLLILLELFFLKGTKDSISSMNLLNPIIILALFVTIVFATTYAFYVQTAAQHREIPAEYIALVFSFEPVFALFTSILIGDELISTQKIFGATLIFISLIGTTLFHSSKVTEHKMRLE